MARNILVVEDDRNISELIRMYPSGESDSNLVKNAMAGQVDYAYTKSVEDVLALEAMENMKVTPVNVRYTRLLYVNKFPHAEK